VFIRNDILVDCHIKFPSTAGGCLYVQAITVSAGLVTVVFGASDGSPQDVGYTIATVSVPQPVAPYVNYPITGLIPGISGWVVFGPGVDTSFVGRYSKPIQTLLQPRCARPYRALPIPTLGKINLEDQLIGVITLAATTPVTAKYTRLVTAGTPRTAVIFAIDTTQITTNYNPLIEFLGPCGQRPESGTCPKPAIESINGIQPDCAGNIALDFVGFTPRNFTACGGLDVLADTGLAEICAANKPPKPQEFSDDCCNPDSPVFDGENEYCWPDPTTQIDTVVDETIVAPDYPCLNLPLCIDFSACTISPYFETRDGRFFITQTRAPEICPCSIPAPDPDADPNTNPDPIVPPELPTNSLTDHNVYAAGRVANLNISVLRNCPTDWVYERTIAVETRIGASGLTRNAGLILNYKQELVLGVVTTTYIVALLDAAQAQFRILRYNNSQFIEEARVNFDIKLTKWYRISLNPVLAAPVNDVFTTVNLNFAVTVLDENTAGISGTVPMSISTFGQGLAGIFANRSYAVFNRFTVT
jgi:hypothetical protein